MKELGCTPRRVGYCPTDSYHTQTARLEAAKTLEAIEKEKRTQVDLP